MKDITDMDIRMRELDERLRPIAKRTVYLSKVPRQYPLDEAGVRSVAETLLEDLIDNYQKAEETTRKAIREMFLKYRSFSWAATLAVEPSTEDSFLQHLILFSMKDQSRDPRDAILALQHLCKRATAAGVNIKPILQQVAQLSSDEDRYKKMGSTRDLLKAAS